MSPGYGNKIYRKQKVPVVPILLSLAVLAVVIFLLGPGTKSGVPEGGSRHPRERPPQENRLPDPPRDSPPESSRSAGPPEENRKNSFSPDENPVRENSRKTVTGGESRLRDLENLSFTARFHFRQNEYRKALRGFRELMKSDPQYTVWAGRCHFHLEEYDRAHDCLVEAVKLNPDDFQANRYMALTCYRLDRLADSLRFTERALDIQKDPRLESFQDRLVRELDTMKGYANRKTPGFKIIFSQHEHSEIRFKVMDILKTAFREIGREINHYPGRPVTVILYNEKGFFDITRAPSWAGGLYDGKIRLPIRGAGGQEKLLRRVLFHEYTHALVHDLTPECPLWLNEGLAEYFSSQDRKPIGQVIPLRHLEKRFPAGDPRLVAIAYMESHSAVSHLISQFGLYRIKELLTELGRGKPLAHAFRTVFHQGYGDFLKNWGKE